MVVIIPNKRLEFDNLCYEFPYRLDDFQMNGIYGFENSNHILITAHTSAGKSTLAEYAIAKSLQLNKKVIYTSPIKTLSNQKYFDFKNRFDDIGILTGDIKLNPESKCLIMTTEILRNKIDTENDSFEDVHCVIFDEVHYFNDPDRGFVWEESITKLPDNILIIMLSATIDKSEQFAQWVSNIKNRDVYLIGTKYRPVPLKHYIFKDDNIHHIYSEHSGVNNQNLELGLKEDNIKPITLLNKISNFLKNKSLFPAIVFTFSRKKCERYALMLKKGESLLTVEEQKELKVILYKIFATNLNIYKDIPSTLNIIELLYHGVAYHHSGLIPIQKEIIEILFQKGFVKILFATETFAVGVNMPTKSVIFTELSKFDGLSDYPRLLRSDEYLQMSGRAGRRGKDKEGYVIYCPLNKKESKCELISLLKGKPAELVSQYKQNSNVIIRLMNNNTSVLDFYKKSMFGNEINEVKEQLNKEIFDLQSKRKSNDYDGLSEEEKLIVQDYDKLSGKISKLNSNKKKKVLREIEELKKNFSKKIKEFIKIKDENREYNCSINELLTKKKEINNHLNEQINNNNRLYYDLGLINKNNNEINLTSYGKIVANLTNCSEILLGWLISERFFDELDQFSMIYVIALLITDKKDEEDINIEFIGKNNEKILDNVQKEYKFIEDVYNQYNLESEIVLSKKFIKSINMWMNDTDIIQILKEYDNYDGDFIKNIYKIRDICMEIIKIGEIFQIGNLIEKSNKILDCIVKGILEFNSLYIHHYDLVKSLIN